MELLRVSLVLRPGIPAPLHPEVVVVFHAGDHAPLARKLAPAHQHGELHVGNGVQERLVFGFHARKSHVDAGNHVRRMVFHGLPQRIDLRHAFAHPQIIVDLQPAALRLLRAVHVQLQNAPPPFHLGIHERDQVHKRPVVIRGLLKRRDLVRRQRHLLFRRMLVRQVAAIHVDPVRTVLVQDTRQTRQHKRAPSGTRGRAPGHVPIPHNKEIALAAPFLAEPWMRPLDETGRGVGQHLHPAPMGHLDEAPVPCRVARRILVAAKQAQGIIPVVEYLQHLNPVLPEPVQLRFVLRAGVVRRAAGILAQVVAALRGQVVRNQMFTHTGAYALRAAADVLQAPAVVFGRELPQERGCGSRSLQPRRNVPFRGPSRHSRSRKKSPRGSRARAQFQKLTSMHTHTPFPHTPCAPKPRMPAPHKSDSAAKIGASARAVKAARPSSSTSISHPPATFLTLPSAIR